MLIKLKTHSENQLYFWGIDLIKAREELRLSQGEFASLCGWTQQNQQQLEVSGIKHHLTFERRQAFHTVGIEI